MLKEFPNRIHGDGRIIINPSFYRPLEQKEIPLYFGVLDTIMQQAKLNIPHSVEDADIPGTLLVLRQRLMIGYSNGCPWPKKAIVEFIEAQEHPPVSLEELGSVIGKSAVFDAKHSFLFQGLLKSASPELQNELLSYHPWEKLEGQEEEHLPSDITDLEGEGAYGLAYDPPYFKVMIPLWKFIEEPGLNQDEQHARFFAVTDFFEKRASQAHSIDELVNATQKFLRHPVYFKQYLPKKIQTS